MQRKEILMVSFIFFFVLAMSLAYSFRNTYFSDDQSFFNLRQAGHIKETSLPLYQDSLSFSGRSHVFLPLFHYVVAFFALFMPLIVAGKLVSSLFLALTAIAAYVIALDLTKNQTAALLTSLVSGFVPIVFSISTNQLSPLTMILFLLLISIHFFMNIEKKNMAYYFLISYALLLFTSTIALLFLFSISLYFIIIKIDKLKRSKEEAEIFIFISFFSSWFLFVVFKDAMLLHGTGILWQNIPASIISQYFKETNIILAITLIGAVPFLFGLNTIYRYTFESKSKQMSFLISFAIVAFLTIWFRIIRPEIGLSLLGMIMVLLLSHYLKALLLHIEKSRFPHFKWVVFFGVFFIFILTSLYPSTYFSAVEQEKSPSTSLTNAMLWIKENTKNDSVILAHNDNGNLITYMSERKNVVDNNFLLIGNANGVIDEVSLIYRSPFATESVSLIKKYDVDYIIFSEKEQAEFGFADYFSQECFKLVFDNGVKVIRPLCEIEVI